MKLSPAAYLLLTVILPALIGSAHAADPDLGRNLAATCANCHGTNGRAIGGSAVLAGVSKAPLLQSLNAFKKGEKSATVMNQLAKGYSEAQLEAIAGYFAAQK